MKVILLLVLSLSYIQSKLMYVNQQYRHGARGNLHGQYLNNTSTLDEYWNGELTPTGERQHYVLGQTLKQQYIQSLAFLDPKYNQDQFYVRSTDVNRTLMSAESQLYGLFATGFGPQIPEGLNPDYTIPPQAGATPITDLGDDALPHLYQPIPIHTDFSDYNPDLQPTNPNICPNYDDIYNQWLSEPEQEIYKFEITEEFSKTAEEVSNVLQQSVKVSQFSGIRDNILCDVNAGLQSDVPEQLLPGTDLYEKIDYVSNIDGFWFMNCEECRKIVNTNLFLQYIKNFDSAVKGTTQRWYMVSAHDTNLQYVMPFLNLTSTDCITELYKTGQTKALNCNTMPLFAANLIMELHVQDDKEGSKDEDDYYIKIIYNGVEQNVCEKKKTECVYSEFKQRILDTIYTKKELKEVCGEPKTTNEKKQEKIVYTNNFDQIGRNVVAYQLEQEKQQQQNQEKVKLQSADQPQNIEQQYQEQPQKSLISQYFIPIVASQILVLLGIIYKTFKN